MSTVYCISGLGADHHIFDGLDVPGVSWAHLSWLMPEGDESLESYARRMSAGVIYASQGSALPPGDVSRVEPPLPVSDALRGPALPAGDAALVGEAASAAGTGPVLLGVSFGGMMAIEIAKLFPAATVILVSSIRHRRQLPLPIKMTRHLGLDKWTPPANWRLLAPIQDYFLGVETRADSRLVREYRGNVDPHYLQWAIRQIAGWRNEWQPAALYHIHGSKDRVFPLHLVEPTHVVEGGGHLMIHNRAEEISGLLAEIFTKTFGFKPLGGQLFS
jgi:pimeloyl-ACP methyl ester carboxylesterase